MSAKNNEVSRASYGKRPDGTEKGSGWLGELKLPDGHVATEYSVGVDFDGKETLIPSLVPTLTKEQVGVMVNDVIPNGKKVPDDVLKAAVEHAKARMAKGESVWAPTNTVKSVRQDAKGGDVRSASNGGDNGAETDAEVPVQGAGQEVPAGGPRIAVNPAVFRDRRDALCVAFNEAYRVVMEMNGFDPVSEPTDVQRRFFSDTAYADDETMLRRTILARICTFDTSVGDPTDEQLQEAVEFLETVMEIGAPQNEWEQSIVQRTHDILKASVGMPRKEREPENPAPKSGGTNEAAGGGETADDTSRTVRMVTSDADDENGAVWTEAFNEDGMAAMPSSGTVKAVAAHAGDDDTAAEAADVAARRADRDATDAAEEADLKTRTPLPPEEDE